MEEARKELAGYWYAEKVIKDGEFKLIDYRSRANKLTATYQLQEGGRTNDVSNRLADYAILAAQEVDEIGAELKALKERNTLIRKVIFERMYGKYQMILAETYIYGMKPKEVAEEIDVDLKHLYHERDRAISIYAKIRSENAWKKHEKIDDKVV